MPERVTDFWAQRFGDSLKDDSMRRTALAARRYALCINAVQLVARGQMAGVVQPVQSGAEVRLVSTIPHMPFADLGQPPGIKRHSQPRGAPVGRR